MSEIATVELDLAKNVFRAHGPDSSGRVLLERDQVLPFFSPQPRCAVTMDACGVRTSAAARLASLDTNLKAEKGNQQAAISRQARDAEVAGRLMMIAGISA